MNLYEIRELIISSPPEAWNKITVWGYGAGPSYRYGLFSETVDGRVETEARGHSELAVLFADPDISIAWGFDPDEEIRHSGSRHSLDYSDFLPSLPVDDDASRMYADVFLRGSLIDRQLLAVVDGARYYVPLPRTVFPNKTGYGPKELGAPEHHYTRWDIGLAKLVQSLSSGEDLDSVLSRMEYVVDDE